MGEFDFTYELPSDFTNRVLNFLLRSGNTNMAKAFKNVKYEYEILGFAYYHGFRGDNWHKKAINLTVEGLEKDIRFLESNSDLFIEAISKSIKPRVTGFLINEVDYYCTDTLEFEFSLISSDEERLNADVKTANRVLKDIIKVGEKVCLNQTYDGSSSENSINDYFRDVLDSMDYEEVKDQTRHGISLSGKDAGEVDLLLKKEGKEVAIFEGMKLKSVDSNYIDKHITKSIINYNALGTSTFVVAYINSPNFESFWERYFNYLNAYSFSLDVKSDLNQLAYPNASTRVANIILSRNGYDFPLYFIALKIS